MKLRTRRSRTPKAGLRNGHRVIVSRAPSFADAVKRLSGIMDGASDLSTREGFGSKVSG